MERKTKIINWRGGKTEFATNKAGTTQTLPPWYVIEVVEWKPIHTNDDGTKERLTIWDRPWFDWIDYLGPPKLFLTKRRAQQHAKDFRKQYTGAKVRVRKVVLEHID